MNISQSTKKSNNDSLKTRQRIITLPIILMIVLIPLAVRGITVNTYLSNYEWYNNASKRPDVFLYIKSVLFLILSSFMLAIMLYYMFKPFMYKRKIDLKAAIVDSTCFIPLGIYLLLIVISTIFSSYSDFALRGFTGQYESMWVLLGYGLAAFYTYLFIVNIQQVKAVVNSLIIVVSIITILGITQYLGYDFFKTSFGKSLISKNELTFQFDKGHVYSTLYNPNYVGLFATLVVPLLVILIINSKKMIKKVLYTVLIIAVLITTYGSRSFSGMIGIGASLIILLILCMVIYRKSVIKHSKKIICSIIALAIIGTITNIAVGNPIGKKVGQVITSIKSGNDKVQHNLTSIKTQEDAVTIEYNENLLNIQLFIDSDQYDFRFLDSTGQELTYQISDDGTNVTLEDTKFSGLVFSVAQVNDLISLTIECDGTPWYFTNQTDGTYYYINGNGKLLKIDVQDEMKKIWSIGSGRGYIWSESIDILKDHPILGTGPDTFAFYFPNTDYLNLHYAQFDNQIITKPHSIYLQIAIQTGIPSLIVFLTFYIMYAISSIRLYCRKGLKEYETQIAFGILIGSFGYMVACIANDSIVTVAPIFWILIGLGLAINRIIKKNI